MWRRPFPTPLPLGADGVFFAVRLRLGVRLHMARAWARAWDLRALVQPLQIVPPALHGHRSPQPFAHPRRDRTRRPERLYPASRRRSGERLTQLLLVRGREERLLPMRRAARMILHPDRTLRVVATSELADPVARIPRALSHLPSPLAPGEQPEALPPPPFMRLPRLPTAPSQLGAA